MNRGSFDCSFLLLLCFCCFHFLKQRDFYTSYGIYRRYGCLSKCRNNLLLNLNNLLLNLLFIIKYNE